MALKGGSADKSGNIYESYWAVEDICHMLLDNDNCSSIYFEKPDEIQDGYEYILNKHSKNYCIQVKNYDEEWTISNFYNKGILSNFVRKLDNNENTICVFLSSSKTALDEIVNRAQKAENVDLFFSSMITSKKLRKTISELEDKIKIIKFSNLNIKSMNISELNEYKYKIHDYIFNFKSE